MTKDEHIRRWENIADSVNLRDEIAAHEAISEYISLLEENEHIFELFSCKIDSSEFYRIIYKNPAFLEWDLTDLCTPFSIMQEGEGCLGSVFRYLSTRLGI